MTYKEITGRGRRGGVMNKWNYIMFRTVEDPARYERCRVRLSRGGALITGRLDRLSHEHCVIGGMALDFRPGDMLQYDTTDAVQPRPLYDDETKALGRRLHSAYLKGRGGPTWICISSSEQLAWYAAAAEARKSACSDDPESDDLDGRELQLAVAKKLALLQDDHWDIAKNEKEGEIYMQQAQEIIDLINRVQGTS